MIKESCSRTTFKWLLIPAGEFQQFLESILDFGVFRGPDGFLWTCFEYFPVVDRDKKKRPESRFSQIEFEGELQVDINGSRDIDGRATFHFYDIGNLSIHHRFGRDDLIKSHLAG